MFDLAKGMQGANRVAFKTNPRKRKGRKELIRIAPSVGGKPYEIEPTLIGEGTFSEAYLTDDQDVILLTTGEETKSMLAHIYTEYGELPYVPKVEYVGDAFTDDGDYQWEAFRSPLYKMPLEYSEHPKAYHMYQLLAEIVKRGKNSVEKPYDWESSESEIQTVSRDSRLKTIQILKQSKRKKPPKIGDIKSDLTLAEWKEFTDIVMFLIALSFEWSDYWLLDVWKSNVAVDGNGQLILLDIFFDKLAESQDAGRY